MDNQITPFTKSPVRSRNFGGPPTVGFAKMPPQALDIEEAVLGAILLQKEAIFDVMEFLKPESFYKEAHQHIFAAMLVLINRHDPIDFMTVTMELRRQGAMEIVGGPSYLTGLTNRLTSGSNVIVHARYVQEMAIKRQLIQVSSAIEKNAYEDTSDVFELLDDSEQKLFEILDSNIKRNYMPINEVLEQALADLEKRKEQKDGLTGIPSGFSRLDAMTAGWQKGALIIIAARPGMGKTAFILSASRNAAVDFGKAVAIFSLEMPAVDLATRLMSSEASIESEKLKTGKMLDHEWGQLTSKISKLSSAPIFIDDTSALNVLELRAKCRRLKSQGKLDIVIIDYLQLMSGGNPNAPKGGNREQEIAYISRSLKQMAKELEVPVIALSQLSRDVEKRGSDKTPQLSDLRESGSLEQDADMVIFLYRPEYYGINEDENGNSLQGVGKVIISKHRAGSTGTIDLRFIGAYTKFTDLDDFNGNFGGGYTPPGPAGGAPGGGGAGGFGGGFPGSQERGIPSEFSSGFNGGAGQGNGSMIVKSGLKNNKNNGDGGNGANPINPLDNVPF